MEIETHGFAELDRKLQQIPEDVARRIMGEALKAGAKPIQLEAERRAPKRTGRLVKAITIRIHRMASQAVEALIGVRGPEAHIARFEEMGTAPHTISVKKAAAATIGKKGLASKETGQFFGKTVHHPGSAPRPFLRPALDTKAEEALDVMGKVLMREIEERHGQR